MVGVFLLHNISFAQFHSKRYKDSALKAYRNAKNDTAKIIALTNFVQELVTQEADRDTALRIAKFCLQEARKIKDAHSEMRALYALSLVYQAKKIDTTAVECWSKCITLNETANYPQLMASVYLKYGQYLSDQSAYPESELLFLKGLSFCDSVSQKAIYINLVLEYGVINYYLFKYSNALDAYFNVVKLAGDDPKYEQEKGKAFTNMGILYQNLSDYKWALKYYHQALDIFKRANDKGNIANIFTNLGGIYYESGNDTAALHYDNMALKYAQETKNPFHIGNAYNQLATLYRSRFCNDSLAFNLYFKELDQRIKAENPYYEASCRTYIAQLYDSLGHFNEAEKYYKEAIAIAERAEAYEQVVYTLAQMAVSYKRQNKINEAIEYCLKTLSIAQNIPDFRAEERIAAMTLADIYRDKGDIEKFLMYNDIEEKAKESEHEHLLKKLQIVYEVDRKNKDQIDLLNQENFLQQEEIRQQRMKFWFLLIAFVLLMLVGAVLFKNNRIRQETNLQLADKNQELHDLNRIKDRMFFLISHDLRGPLCSLRGALSLIEAKILSDEQQKKLSNGLIQKFNEASTLMDNVLYWATIQLGELSGTPEAFSIKTVVEECVNELQTVAAKKNITIEKMIETDTVAEADRHLLTLTMKNLLNNAIKYTEPNGTVKLSVKRGEKFHLVAIEDSGKGISPNLLKHLFEFHADPSAGTAGEKGVGIGLMLSKQLIETNGGSIKVENASKKGSIFSFTIPAKINDPQAVIVFKEKFLADERKNNT